MATPTSSQAAAKQNGTARTTGRKRKVASQAGVARYHKPIGSEIGGPRDANHAEIQKDQGARKNYGDLVGGDSAKQRKALEGMSTEDLNKLADIAFSFRSSNPQVVALRVAARNAQAKRGIRVKAGQTQTNAKPAPAKVNYNNRGSTKALSRAVGPDSARLIELAAQTAEQHTTRSGSFPIPDVAHLRKAIQAIGRAKPEQRPMVARHILARAKALKAEHLVSDHIKHYARGGRQPGSIGMSVAEVDAIELAGRWKHGYIPLDAVALHEKMKGRTGGKKWWGDHAQGGVSGNLKPHGSPKSGSPKRDTPFKGGKERQGPMPDVSKMSETQLHARYAKAPVSERQHYLTEIRRRNAKATERMHAKAPSAEAINKQLDRRDTIGKDRARALGDPLTNVVKSGSADSKPRGAKVTNSDTRTVGPDQAAVQRNKEKLANTTDPARRAELQRRIDRDSKPIEVKTPGKKPEPKVNHRTQIARINHAHDDAVREARRTGATPPKFPYDKVRELKGQEAHAKNEEKIATRIASGKGKLTQGVLSASQMAEVTKLQDAGKHDEAGALSRKYKAESRDRIAKLVAAKKAVNGPGKA